VLGDPQEKVHASGYPPDPRNFVLILWIPRGPLSLFSPLSHPGGSIARRVDGRSLDPRPPHDCPLSLLLTGWLRIALSSPSSSHADFYFGPFLSDSFRLKPDFITPFIGSSEDVSQLLAIDPFLMCYFFSLFPVFSEP